MSAGLIIRTIWTCQFNPLCGNGLIWVTLYWYWIKWVTLKENGSKDYRSPKAWSIVYNLLFCFINDNWIMIIIIVFVIKFNIQIIPGCSRISAVLVTDKRINLIYMLNSGFKFNYSIYVCKPFAFWYLLLIVGWTA